MSWSLVHICLKLIFPLCVFPWTLNLRTIAVFFLIGFTFIISAGNIAPGFGIGALEDLDAEDEDVYASGKLLLLPSIQISNKSIIKFLIQLLRNLFLNRSTMFLLCHFFDALVLTCEPQNDKPSFLFVISEPSLASSYYCIIFIVNFNIGNCQFIPFVVFQTFNLTHHATNSERNF